MGSTFRTKLLLIATLAFAAVFSVRATQVMHRPANYKAAPHNFTEGHATPHVIHKRATGKVNMAYFTNWGIYGANFQPTDINPGPLTQILYAFADVSPDTGAISLTDSYADEQKHFPGDSWSETGNNLYGCLKQLYLLKMANRQDPLHLIYPYSRVLTHVSAENRNLKITLSVGGWTYSQDGHFSFVTDATKRQTFVNSALQLIEDYGLDGLDLDFEYPSSAAQGQGFADLVTALRSAFDSYATKKGDTVPYSLTAAVSAGAANYQYLVVPQMDKALTFWNLMALTYIRKAYDYAGSWLTFADNQANLYGGQRTGVSTDAAVSWYISQGATPDKIVMGLPLYGRAFENTNGLGQSYSGIGPGTIEAGVYSYNVLPLASAQVFENVTDVSSYSYDSTKKELVSYDTPHIASLKAQYVTSKGLGGNMFWDLSTDKTGSDSLVSTTANVFGALDQTQNHLDYPNSKWDNIRSNMGTGTGGGGSSTSTTAPTGTSTSSSPTSSPTGGSGQCAGVVAWTSAAVFTGGQKATYNGHLWTAKWWTEGDIPGGAAGVWTDNGAC
ncbi:glycoside hydrolase superfamily [Irpex rosettiformis]|uniref:Glycoside hydrolase superfamily n=1 Tax=Irpex rosettiformis TaxID=378272 RepID=A0ACB8U8W8_9APHY|nr:glycoside hydrolase superfamily [Irpex rosettiformis]